MGSTVRPEEFKSKLLLAIVAARKRTIVPAWLSGCCAPETTFLTTKVEGEPAALTLRIVATVSPKVFNAVSGTSEREAGEGKDMGGGLPSNDVSNPHNGLAGDRAAACCAVT